ncbi:MAG: inorganic diphosphatase [Bacteroidota bacterium]
MRHTFHPWHDVSPGDDAPFYVKAIIEIPKGSKAKYELDKDTGLLKLDRMLFSSVHYPANYGFIPQTFDDDKDPLDILVICSEDVPPLCMIDAKVIGVMNMIDGEDADNKIIAVARHDISVNYINTISELPPHTLTQMKRFFEDYKVLEHKKVTVEDFQNEHIAYRAIERSMGIYRETYGPNGEKR